MGSKLELAWPEEQQHVVFRELAIHAKRMGRYAVASGNYGKAVQANPYALDSHFGKSVAELKNSDRIKALASVREGLAVERDEEDPRGEDFDLSLHECHTLFEIDEFEEHVRVTSDRAKPFGGHRKKDFDGEIRLAHRNYENVLGFRAGPCLYEQRHRLKAIAEERAQAITDDRPAWKIKRAKGECDAVSLVEIIERETHIREKERQDKNLRTLGQVYLNHGWKDLAFLNTLRKGGVWEKTVNLPEAPESSKVLSDTIEECFEKVHDGLQSLQSRTPFYTYRRNRFGNSDKAKDYLMDNIFKIRYKTYRDVYNQLDRMHELRNQNQLLQLREYTADVLWNYYQLKTERVFPDRYKFVNEVCNLVGLAIVDSYVIPTGLMDEPLQDRLLILFQLPLIRDDDKIIVPIFGDKSTYRDPAAPDYGYIAYKNQITLLEKRVPYSRYALERAFLYHEMCQHHLTAGKLDETRIMARRIVEEAKSCGSNLWKFLGTIALVRADCAQMNLEKLTVTLEDAHQAVTSLDDERLEHVVQIAKIINNQLIYAKFEKRDSTQLNRMDLS
ncbi:uncharacterized protein LOC129748130 [Uranotaenia lowii]|uniref:uncharacterized protein LOC129748130 n=1 Tax=Uranotaenia lowii TaxID=190385 RepID=UPI00247B0A58|nr:uncharacterized protein LOC129748130 [Uranotaenia lowii]